MTLGEILVRLRADVGRFDQDIGQAVAALGRLKSAGAAAGAGASAGLAMVGTAVAMVGLASVKAAADFESAFAKVRRVLSEAEGGTKELSNSIIKLSTQIPVSATQLAEMASMAGQMGIRGEANVMKFVEVVARLGVTAEMSGDKAAMMMARIAQVGGLTGQWDQLGSAIVGVSSDFNATTEEVMRMTMQMQGLASQAGVSTQTMLALSATLASAGIRAEAGGTAIGRMMADIARITSEQGPKLEALAKLMGMTGEQVRAAWAEDKGGFVLKVFQELHKEGTNSIKVLDELGWKNVRVAGAAGALAKSNLDLAKAMESVNSHFRNGTELQRQSQVIFETLNSKLTTLKNAVTAVAIQWGANLLPAVSAVITGLTGLVNVIGMAYGFWNRLPLPVQALISPLHQVYLYVKLVAEGFKLLDSTLGITAKVQAVFNVFRNLATHVAGPLLNAAVAFARQLGGMTVDALGAVFNWVLRVTGALASFIGNITLVIPLLKLAAQGWKEIGGLFGVDGGTFSDLAASQNDGLGGFANQAAWLKNYQEQRKKLLEQRAANSPEAKAAEEAAAKAKKHLDDVKEAMAELRDVKLHEQMRVDADAIKALGGIAEISAKQLETLANKYKGLGGGMGNVSVQALVEQSRRRALDQLGDEAQLIAPQFMKPIPGMTARLSGGLADFDTDGDKQAAANYNEILASLSEVDGRTKKNRVTAQDWSQALQDVRNSFELLGITADSTLGRTLGGIANAITASQTLAAGLATGNPAQIISGGTQMLAGAVTGLKGAFRGPSAGSRFSSGFTGSLSGGGGLLTSLAIGGAGALFGGSGPQQRKGADTGFEGINELLDQLGDGFDRNNMSANELASAFDKAFNEIAPHAISRTTGLLSTQAEELIRVARQSGIASEGIKTLMAEQAKSLAANLATGLEAMSPKGAGLASQGAASAIGASIAATFEELRKSMPAKEALETLAPAIEAFRQQLNAAGLEGGAAFGAIEHQLTILTGEITGPLVEGVTAFTGALANMHNMGLLNQEVFRGITEQVGANIIALQEQGVQGPALIAALQPSLQAIWEMQQRTGYAVDETTQSLIDMGVEGGQLGEKFRSSQDQMIDGLNRVVSAIQQLTAALAGIPKEINTRVNVTTNYSGGEPPGAGANYVPDEYEPDYTAASGFFSESMPWGRRKGGGTLLEVHPGEQVSVIPKSEKQRMGAEMPAPAQEQPLYATIYIDGRKLQEYVTRATKSGAIRVHPDAIRDFQ